jgi:HlyD family secretion protein
MFVARARETRGARVAHAIDRRLCCRCFAHPAARLTHLSTSFESSVVEERVTLATLFDAPLPSASSALEDSARAFPGFVSRAVMKRSFKVLSLVAIVALVGVTAAWYLNRGDPAATYRTVAARRADIVATISATGTIVPEDVVDVGAQVNGQIASFGKDVDGKSVDYRSTVQEGMVLARIDDALFQADVATAEAQLAQAKAQVTVNEANRDQAKAHLDQTQRDWDRAQKLSGSPALSATDFDTARANYEQAVASRAMAEANIVQARAAINMADASVLRARRNLTYCTIASPVNGVILDRRVEIGQTVVASLSAPSLFLIAKDLRRMEVLVQVNEADIGHVQPGQDVAFVSDAYPGETFHGTVKKVRLNATQTQNVVTYTVEILTENSDLRLLPYLTANVTFEVARSDNALAVPNAALRWAPREPVRAAMRENARGSAQAAGEDATRNPANASAPGAASMSTPSEASTAMGSTASATIPSAAGASSSDSPKADAAHERTRGRSRASHDASNDAQRPTTTVADASAKPPERAPSKPSFVWLQSSDGSLRRVRVHTGLTDGTLTEVIGDGIAEGDEIIVGEKTAQAGAAGAPAENTNPFMPQVFRNNNNRRAGTAPGAPQQTGAAPAATPPPPAR